MANALFQTNSYDSGQHARLGANSAVFIAGDFVVDAGGIVDVAVAAGVISGTAVTKATMTADNQTVAGEKVVYRPTDDDDLYSVDIAGGTITIADEGKYFDLTDKDTVDGTTESTTTGQVQLFTFVTATRGIFKIVNA